MSSTPETYNAFIDFVVGKRLTHIARAFYEFEGVLDEREGHLEVGFGGEVYVLTTGNDGESLRIDRGEWLDFFTHPLIEENQLYVDESGCHRHIDCADIAPYSQIVGSVVRDAKLVVNQFKTIAGVVLKFDALNLWFSVAGDEDFVTWDILDGYKELP